MYSRYLKEEEDDDDPRGCKSYNAHKSFCKEKVDYLGTSQTNRMEELKEK